jgi:DNA repair protein RecO (recombination protein O)
MTRNARRVELTAGYVLHHRPYRDTSRILEVLTREHGRLTLFARGVRGPKAKLASVLRPFVPLLLSWSGRGEASQLTGAEPARAMQAMPSAAIMAGFYVNELMMKLTTRHDPNPAAYDAYALGLDALCAGEPLEPALRLFEKRLLEAVGYGLDLASDPSGAGIEPGRHYEFRPAEGLYPSVADAPGALAGDSLLRLAREEQQ